MPNHQELIADADIVGRLAEVVSAHPGQIVLHDLYDEVGARVYDDTAAGDTSEIRELSQLVRRVDGPILELAAGSGRLTLPLTRLGREVVALERSLAMVSLLKDKCAKLPERQMQRMTVVNGDMSDFSLDRRFGSIVLGTASISLLSPDQRRGFFACADAHLQDSGRLWLSIAEFDPVATVDDIAVLPGRSGAEYYLYNAWTPGQPHRFVGVVPSGDHEPLEVSISHPAIIDIPAVLSEIRHANLEVLGRHSIAGTWSTVDEYYLEIGRAHE